MMAARTYCAYCETELDSGQALRYEMNSLDFANEEIIEVIRADPRYFGEPLPLCVKCAASIGTNSSNLEEDETFDRKQTPRLLAMLGLALIAALLVAWFLN
jgi:hypothetical protein